MPKLSKNSLEKRFTCQYCSRSLRTRQGLSGHIQFKHATSKKKSNTVDMAKDVEKKLEIWKVCVRTIGYPPEVSQAGDRLIRKWRILREYSHLLGTDLNDKDFKHFILHNFDY